MVLPAHGTRGVVGHPQVGTAARLGSSGTAQQSFPALLLVLGSFETKLKRSHLSLGKAGRKSAEVQAHIACKQLHLLPS